MAARIKYRKGKRTVSARVEYTDVDGSVRSRTFSSGTPAENKADASVFANTARREVSAGLHISDAAAYILDDVFASWEKYLEEHIHEDGKKFSKATITGHASNWRNHIEPVLGGTIITKITTGSVSFLVKNLESKGCTNARINKVRITLKLIIAHATHEQWHYGENPVTALGTRSRPITGSAGSVTKQKIVAPSHDEVRQIIEHASGWFKIFVLLAAHTGLRSGELRGLRWGDVTFQGNNSGILEIQKAADRDGNLGPAKTDGAARLIPFGLIIHNALKDYALVKRESHLDLIFPNDVGNAYQATNLRNRQWLPLIQRLNWWKNKTDNHGRAIDGQAVPLFGIHALRHFCISNWIRAGLRGKALTVPVGHKNESFTRSVYWHLFEDEIQESYERIIAASESLAA
jgi:integrase